MKYFDQSDMMTIGWDFSILRVNGGIDKQIRFCNFIPKTGDVFVQSVPEYVDWSFVQVIMGSTLCELFRRIRLPHSWIINFLGSATFMVCLCYGR